MQLSFLVQRIGIFHIKRMIATLIALHDTRSDIRSNYTLDWITGMIFCSDDIFTTLMKLYALQTISVITLFNIRYLKTKRNASHYYYLYAFAQIRYSLVEFACSFSIRATIGR
jgi:hypothetical protein